MGKKYRPVEVKLSIRLESNIKKQLRKYCYDDYIILDERGKTPDNKDVIRDEVIVIDTEAVYVYLYSNDTIYTVYNLDNLKEPNDADIVRDMIINHTYLLNK